MNANLASFIRMLLAAGAAFLIGKTWWGTPLTSQVTDTIIAVLMEVLSVVWGLRAHTVDIEKLQSTVRNFFSLAGGFFVSRGLITTEQSVLIVGALVSASAYLYSILSKKKSQQLDTSKIQLADLKKPS